MKRSRRKLLFGAALAFLLGISSPSSAQTGGANSAAADALFNQAKQLMDAGKPAEACPLLEESYRLDPAMGTQFRLAECYEQSGKVASAWSTFLAVVNAATQTGNTVRADTAQQRAAALESRVPKLTITISSSSSGIAGIEVKRNGVAVGQPSWGRALPVDPGEQQVTVTAPGKKPWEKKVRVQEGATVEVKVGELEDAPASAKPEVPKASGPTPAGSQPDEQTGMPGQRKIAIAISVVGGIGVVVGSISGGMAFAQWSNAKAKCGMASPDCPSATFEPAQDYRDRAATSATISTVSFVVAGAGIAAATILWVTAPSRKPAPARTSLRMSPALGPQGLGAVVAGRF